MTVPARARRRSTSGSSTSFCRTAIPFLMVDRIIDVDGDNSAIGIKNVTVNEPYFPGHFPGQPVMPGVLIIEGMAQTAGAICIAARGGDRPPLVYFMTIDNAKFRRPLFPATRSNITSRRCATAATSGNSAAEAMVGGSQGRRGDRSAR